MTKKNFMEEFVEAYHSDPVRFVQEMLGATPFDYQAEFLRTLAAGERRISVNRVMARVKVQPRPGQCCGFCCCVTRAKLS